jgi:hypothetical protein
MGDGRTGLFDGCGDAFGQEKIILEKEDFLIFEKTKSFLFERHSE